MAALVVASCSIAATGSEPVHAEAAPKSVDTWAWCGVHPDDPAALTAARSMAVYSGVDATFGPCKEGDPGYTAAFPLDRYVSPELYRRLVVINRDVGMQTVVYDSRIWSADPAVRTAAKVFWRSYYEDIAAWDMGDEFDPRYSEWSILIERTNIVLDDVTLDSDVQPYTNHLGFAVEDAIADVPGSTRMLSFDSYGDDGGESIARSIDSRVQTLMCAVNTYDISPLSPSPEIPTPASIRDTTTRLVDAGCDMILTFGGTQVYGQTFLGPKSTGFGPLSIVDGNGEPTQRATASLESTGYSSYRPVRPARLLETRPGLATIDGLSNSIGVLLAGSTTVLQVAGRAGIRTDASSVVLNLTATNSGLSGFVTAYPCSAARPNVAQLNYAAGATVATTAVVKLAANGSVCLYNLTGTDLIVDVAGFYPSAATTFVALQPARLLETRRGAGLTTVDGSFVGIGLRGANSISQLTVAGRAGVPYGATSATMSVTVTNASQPGFVTAYPCGQSIPPTASVNFPAGAAVTTNAVVSGIAANGWVCFFTSADVDLIVDVNGFSPSGASFVALSPQRVLDSRTEPKPKPRPATNVFQAIRELQVAGVGGVPIDATAVVINVTVTDSTTAGYLTVFPCGTARPNTSSLNFNAGETVSNLAVATVGARGSVCFFSPADPNYVIDITAVHP
ncbi:MAG: hypothetical protein ABIR32_04345 [Ilumatobacteraceae bacterium]